MIQTLKHISHILFISTFLLAVLLPDQTNAYTCNCVANALCLRNGTCYCPYFGDATSCNRERYQTVVKTTWNEIGKINMNSGNLLFTIDSTNYEAMKILTEQFKGLGIWSATSRVIDSLDIQLNGNDIVSMQIKDVNITQGGAVLSVSLLYTAPPSVFYYFYLHMNSDRSNAPCPPYTDNCCVGNLGSDFVTVDVNCNKSVDTQLQKWLSAYNGSIVGNGILNIKIPIASLPSRIVTLDTSGNNATEYAFGIGMISLGTLPQNTESRILVQISKNTNTSVVGSFQYSFIENVNVQLESYGGDQFFVRMIVQASNVEAVHGVKYQWGSNASDLTLFVLPQCYPSVPSVRVCDGRYLACNVTITPVYVEIIFPVTAPPENMQDAEKVVTVYALLSRSSSISRVVSRTDASYVSNCRQPVNVLLTTPLPYDVEVVQGGRTLYRGNPKPLLLNESIVLVTFRLHVIDVSKQFFFSELYILHSRDDPMTLIIPDGDNSFDALSSRCVNDRCIVESILYMGVSQNRVRCEVRANGEILLNPSFRWPSGDSGSVVNVVLFLVVQEKVKPSGSNSRLLRWIMGR